MKPIELYLDLKLDRHDELHLKQNCIEHLDCTLTDLDDPVNLSGYSISVELSRPDGQSIIQTTDITKTGNKVSIKIPKSFTGVGGKAKLQIMLNKGEDVYGTWVVICWVQSGAIDGNTPISNVVTIKDELLKNIAEANKSNDMTIKNIAEANKTNTSLERVTGTAVTEGVKLTGTTDTAVSTNVILEENISKAVAENQKTLDLIETGGAVSKDEFGIVKTTLDEANTDFNKVPHNNLQERLTTDFADIHNRLNKAEIMEFDGSDINAKTFAGYTKEMEIRGKTWQNLLGRKTKNDTGTGLLNTIVVKGNIITIKRDITEEPNTHVGFYIKLPKEMIKTNTVYTIATMIVKNTLSSNTVLIDAPYTGFNLNATITGRTEGIFKKTITTDTGLLKNEIWCWNGRTITDSGEIVFTIPIILEGDYTNKPIPEEYFEGIMSTGEAEMVNGKYKVGVESSGKNLFDNVMEQGMLHIDTGEKVENNSIIRTKNFIEVRGGYTYTLSRNISIKDIGVRCYDSNFKYTGERPNTSGKVMTFKLSEKVRYVKFIDISNDLSNMYQLEEGTTATTYEPHQKDSTSYLLDEPLRSLPNGVQDTISKDGVLSRRVGKVVLDENTTIKTIGDNYQPINKELILFSIPALVKNNTPIICDVIPTRSAQIASKDINSHSISVHSTDTCFRVCIEKSKLLTPTPSSFSLWLRDNNVTILCEGPESILTNLKKKPILKVYEGVTYIKSTNSIKADLAVKLPCNVNLMLSDSLKENKILKDNIQALELENRNINEKQDSNLSLLSDMDTNLVSTSWDMDFRLMEVEFFIEDNSPQTMLKNNKPNRGGNVMALSRFEQAKIMILGGVYVRETLEHQLNTYLKRGYMTKEEVDELIAMMDARDMIEGN